MISLDDEPPQSRAQWSRASMEVKAQVLRIKPHAELRRYDANDDDGHRLQPRWAVFDGQEHLSIIRSWQPSRPEAWRRALAYLTSDTVAAQSARERQRWANRRRTPRRH